MRGSICCHRTTAFWCVVCLSFVFHFTDEKFCLLTFWFLEGVPAGVCDLRLLTHRFPTRIRGRLGLFPSFTPSHTPFPTLDHIKTLTRPLPVELPRGFGIKNNLTNIQSEKKKTLWRDPPEAVRWHGFFSGKRLNNVSVRRVERVYPLLHLYTFVKFQILSTVNNRQSVINS